MASYFNIVAEGNFANAVRMADMISAVRNAFISCSFIRTAQSGSVDNLYSLSARGAANQLVTYDIFAFNDAWQATHPVFIKVRYLSGTATNMPRLDFSMGTANDGSGSLTGPSTLTETTNATTSAATPVSGTVVFAAGDGSYFTMAAFPELGQSAHFAVFERFYDLNGQPTGSGFHMVATNGSGPNKTVYSQAAVHGSGPGVQESIYVPNSRPSAAPAIYNGRLILGLVYPIAGSTYNPSPNVLLGTSTDFPSAFTTFPYTVYGITRQYRALNSIYSQANSRVHTDGRWILRAD